MSVDGPAQSLPDTPDLPVCEVCLTQHEEWFPCPAIPDPERPAIADDDPYQEEVG